MTNLTEDQIKAVKAFGCLKDKNREGYFNVRVITRNGKVTAEELKTVAEAADIYGSGEITLTSRMTLEIQCVHYDSIANLREYLNERGLETGGTGAKVRPVVSCKGTTCQYGLIDTFALSQRIHDMFYVGYNNVALPHKFKIAVGGCPNNCVKPDLNDFGIVGQRVAKYDLSLCKGCKKCAIENNCPIKAAGVENGMLVISEDCNNCGRCLKKCPFKVAEEFSVAYKIYIGGRWGKRVSQGKVLSRLLYSEDEVLKVLERAINFFKDEGIAGERFADTIARIGLDKVEEKLFS